MAEGSWKKIVVIGVGVKIKIRVISNPQIPILQIPLRYFPDILPIRWIPFSTFSFFCQMMSSTIILITMNWAVTVAIAAPLSQRHGHKGKDDQTIGNPCVGNGSIISFHIGQIEKAYHLAYKDQRENGKEQSHI